MNYRNANLRPIEIYEAFEKAMHDGDVLSQYIVEKMNKENVLKTISDVQIPISTYDAIKKGNRIGFAGRFWFSLAWCVKNWILPLVVMTFFSLMAACFILVVLGSFKAGFAAFLLTVASYATYMLFSILLKNFLDMAANCVIMVSTILSNLAVSENYPYN